MAEVASYSSINTTMTTLPCYRRSGEFRLSTVATFLGLVVAGVAVALAYQAVQRLIPVLLLRGLLVCGFALALGFAGANAVRLGHCRNVILAWILGLVLVTSSILASYFWDYQLGLVRLARAVPQFTSTTIRKEISFRRWFELRMKAGVKFVEAPGRPSSRAVAADLEEGWVVAGWASEALIILVIAMWLINAAVKRPYCEACRCWTTAKALLLHGQGRQAASPLLAQRDLNRVITLLSEPRSRSPFSLLLTGHLCESCTQTGFLSIDELHASIDRRRRPKQQKKNLVTFAVMNPEQCNRFAAELARARSNFVPAVVQRAR
ncbi:MAG TPA: hypothetical protein VNU68_33735 [Verrucomicrobiae bacterium]|nr:hypothetical protein [Verrucomicrobiae bacterium]